MPRWACVVAALLANASAHVIYHQYYAGDAAAAHRSSAGAEQLSPTRAHGGCERTSSVDDADSVGDAVHAAAANATRADARVDLRKADDAPRRSIWSWICLLTNATVIAVFIVEAWLCCYWIFVAVINPDEVWSWHDLPRLIVRERFVLIPLGASFFVVYLCARLLYGVDMTQQLYAVLALLAAAAIGAMKDVFLFCITVLGVYCVWPGIWSTPRFDDGQRVEVLYIDAWYPATVRGYRCGLYFVEGVDGARLWLSPSQLRALADDNHSITPRGLGVPGGDASTPASASELPLLTVAGEEPDGFEVFRVGDRVQAVIGGRRIITHVVYVDDSRISVDDGAGGERERPYAMVCQYYSIGDRINVWFGGAWHRAIVWEVRRDDGMVLPDFTDGRDRPRTWLPLRFIRRQRVDDIAADDDSVPPDNVTTTDALAGRLFRCSSCDERKVIDAFVNPQTSTVGRDCFACVSLAAGTGDDDGMAPARRSRPSDDEDNEQDPFTPPSDDDEAPAPPPTAGDDNSFQPEELQSDDDGEVPARRMALARRSAPPDDEENEQDPFTPPSDDDEAPAPPPSPNRRRSSDRGGGRAAPTPSSTPRRSLRLNPPGRWRQEAQELLDLLKDGSVRRVQLGKANVGRATLQRYGFFVYSQGKLVVRPPKHYPSYYDLVGKDSSGLQWYQLKVESNKRLVEYLKKALALADGFQTEEEVRASLGLSMDGRSAATPQKSEEAYKLPGGKRSILISPEGDPEPTAQELSYKGKIFEKDGIAWRVREVSVVKFRDGETRVGCWCYAFDLYGDEPPRLQDQHWCVPCDDLQDVVWDSRRAPRPRRSKRKAAGRLQSELVKRNRRGRRGGALGRVFGERTACGDLSRAGQRLVSEGTAPSQVGNPPGSKPRYCPDTGRNVRECPCGNYPNDPFHGIAIANRLLTSVMGSPNMRGTRNDPARGVTNGWRSYLGIPYRDICPDYTPEQINQILLAGMPKPHSGRTLEEVFKRRQADPLHKFSYDHIRPKSVILGDYDRLRLRPAFDADGRPNVVIRDLCHPYNLQYADLYANCNIKNAAPLSDVSEEHEAWYQARLLCFWDEDELKKPFADRTPRPFETTIRMLKEETRKGHCFLGFKKEVHHEFNY